MKKLKVVRKLTPKDEWQEKLYKQYPKLFAQHDKPMSETCMCWGIAVGIGWFTIIELLCASIQLYWDIMYGNMGQHPEFTQIKEKFGLLRINLAGGDNFTSEMVKRVEWMSEKICERCGSVNGVTCQGDYLLTLCKKCRTPVVDNADNRERQGDVD